MSFPCSKCWLGRLPLIAGIKVWITANVPESSSQGLQLKYNIAMLMHCLRSSLGSCRRGSCCHIEKCSQIGLQWDPIISVLFETWLGDENNNQTTRYLDQQIVLGTKEAWLTCEPPLKSSNQGHQKEMI